jgi:RNA polymerase sigma-70 factor (ECF subfamily)
MQSSDADALSRFHREYRPALMAFFLRRVHDPADAEDLTQEVFIRIADRAEGAGAMRSPDAFIFQIAANLLRDRSRRAKVRADFVAGMRAVDGAGTETLDPWRVAAGRDALARIASGLDELPERTRQIFLLFRYENLGQRAIAESFGISVSAVEKHIYRAMARLMDRIGDAP